MTTKESNQGLIVFVKNPQLGKVKTRLAKTIGNGAALDVYKKLMTHTREIALSVDATRHLFYDQNISKNDDWSEIQFYKAVQSKGDLGQRMQAAFQTVLTKASKAVIIGSDCPEINSEIIEDAFQRLDIADVVIGPTLDGGYYLLGIKESRPYLFKNMPWSTNTVFEKTKQRILEAGLLFSLMPKLSDLDNIEDLNNFPAFSNT